MPAATLRSRSISCAVRGRYPPTARPFSAIGPIAIRVSDMTLWPSFAIIRRISRFFPSASTISMTLA